MTMLLFPELELKVGGAVFSEDRIYRYTLWRKVGESDRAVSFVCLNPSTATETTNDPTVRRCIRYARDWGFGHLYMLNLFGYRSTDPLGMKKIEDPIGPENDYWIHKISHEADLTIAAWGVHGDYLGRDMEVIPLLKDPHCLAKTKDGRHPRHPLYLKASLKPRKL